MGREPGVIPRTVFNKVGRIPFLLAIPAIPKILDAFLVPRTSNDPQRMKIHCTLDDVGWGGFLSICIERVPPQQRLPEQKRLVLFSLNAVVLN